jgi:hypothetical protein
MQTCDGCRYYKCYELTDCISGKVVTLSFSAHYCYAGPAVVTRAHASEPPMACRFWDALRPDAS